MQVMKTSLRTEVSTVRSKLSAAVLSLIIMSTITSARPLTKTVEEQKESLEVRNSRKALMPGVTDSMIYFQKDESYYNLEMTPPVLKAGWETEQSYSTSDDVEYWQVRFKPYTTAYFLMT